MARSWPGLGPVLARSWPGLGPVLGPRSGPPGEEGQDALLEDLVSDRSHMIAPGNLEGLAGRQQGRQFRRGAADHILAAERDQGRDPDRGNLGGRERLARSA